MAEKAKQESATSPDGQTRTDRLKAALQAAALMKEKAEAEARESEAQEETEETEEEIDDVEEDEEEVEVDDDEDAAVAAAASQLNANKILASSNANGVTNGTPASNAGLLSLAKKRDLDEDDQKFAAATAKKAKMQTTLSPGSGSTLLSESVSSFVNDIVKKVDAKPIIVSIDNSEEEEEIDDVELMEDEEEMDSSNLGVVNGSGGEWRKGVSELLLRKQLTEAVKDLSDTKDLKKCLVTKLKTILQCNSASTDQTRMNSSAAGAAGGIKVDNPNQVFTDIVDLIVGRVNAQLAMSKSGPTYNSMKKLAVVTELVKTYHLQQQKCTSANNTDQNRIDPDQFELKIVDIEDNESTTNDSFPPELVPQVDGVDSSAEGKSDDPDKREEGDRSSLDGHQDHKGSQSAAQNQELTENNDNVDEESTTNSAIQANHHGHHNQKTKCDKSKILSEMENKFAKETQNALKNRPTYKKRNKSESWETINVINGRNKSESGDNQSESVTNIESSPRKLILMKEPGELEVANQAASDHQALSDKDIIDIDDDTSQNSLATNDENNPGMIQASSTGNMTNISGGSSSSSSNLKALRKFRKGGRNPSYSSNDSTTNYASDLPSSHLDHDPQDLGPPNITTPPPRSPVKGGGMMSSLSHHQRALATMSPPPHLTPEVGPSFGMTSPTPLRIDIPEHFQHHSHSPLSSSWGSSGYSRRLIIRTPPAARAGLVTVVSEKVLSKEDAEHAATAVTLNPPPAMFGPVITVPKHELGIKLPTNEELHPSLKIRLPKNGNGPSLVITSASAHAAASAASVGAVTSVASVASAVFSVTPSHKKVPKRSRILQNESDEGQDIDTESSGNDGDSGGNNLQNQPKASGSGSGSAVSQFQQQNQAPSFKKKIKTVTNATIEIPSLQIGDHERSLADKALEDQNLELGDRTTPDSQITNEDRQA